MFRSFMPEDNTVTVSKMLFIGDKICLWTPSVTNDKKNDFSLNSVLHSIPGKFEIIM